MWPNKPTCVVKSLLMIKTTPFPGCRLLCVYRAVGTVNCRMHILYVGAGLGGGVLGAVTQLARSSLE